MRLQCDSKAPPRRMQNVECRMQKAAQSQVQARSMRGASQVQARYMRGTCVVQARCKPGECGPRAWWLARTSAATLNGGVRSLSKLAFLRVMVQDCGIVKRRREPASVIRGH